MPRCCFVPGCKSGYTSTRKVTAKTPSFFQPPKDEVLFQQWAKTIPRKDKPLTRNDRVCSLHFSDNQIVKYYEHNINDELIKVERGRPSLATGSVPYIFPNLPAYLSKPLRKRKPPLIRVTIPNKKQKAGLTIEAPKCVILPATEDSSSPLTLKILIDNLKTISLPSSLWSCHVNSTNTIVAFSHMKDSTESLFTIDRIVNIYESLEVKLEIGGKKVPVPRWCMDKVNELHHIEAVLRLVDGLSLCQGWSDDQQNDANATDSIFSKHCTVILDKTKSLYAKRNGCAMCYQTYRRRLRQNNTLDSETRNRLARKNIQQHNRRLLKQLQKLKLQVKDMKEKSASRIILLTY